MHAIIINLSNENYNYLLSVEIYRPSITMYKITIHNLTSIILIYELLDLH